MLVQNEIKNDDVFCLTTNPNKTRFITLGMADGQKSSVSPDRYPAGALLETNGLWEQVEVEQSSCHADNFM